MTHADNTSNIQPSLREDHPLQLVRENAYLAGTWPSNVEAHMVFLVHGPDSALTETDYEAVEGTWAPVGLLLADKRVEVLCIEIGGIAPDMTPDTIAAIFAHLNWRVDRANARGILSDADQFGSAFELGVVTTLAVMHEQGARLPRLAPIDRGGAPVAVPPHESPSLLNLPLIFIRDGIARHEESLRRESMVLPQMFEISRNLGADGQPHIMATVQGISHTRTCEAAEALGARVIRHDMDPIVASPSELLQRMLDTHSPQDIDHNTLEYLTLSASLAQIITQAPENERLLETLDPFDRELLRYCTAEWLGAMCLAGFDNRLPQGTQLAFDEMRQLLRTDPLPPIWQAFAAEFFKLCILEIARES